MIIKSNVRCTELDPTLKYFFRVDEVYSTEADPEGEIDQVLIRDPYGEKWNAYEFGGKVKLYGFEAVFEFI